MSENLPSKSQDYQVIARKFRPQTFSAVLGQEAVVTTLKNALKQNRLAHAYLFCGCRGTGKTTLARIFAKALNCENKTEEGEPCNSCSSCVEIMSGRSLDVLEIDGASNRGIDDIREINETIGYAPSSGKYKLYIIDEVHMLTKEAFNALLKTLEEPPAHVKFLFATTEPHKILPTIVSRCQRFDLNRISQKAMEQKLEQIATELKVSSDPDALSLLANLSEGSLRDAESLFDQIICCVSLPITALKICDALGLMSKDVFFELDQAIAEGRSSFAFTLCEQLFSSGKDLAYFLDHLLEHFRTLLVIRYAEPACFLNAHQKECYKRSLQYYTEEQCLYILDYLIGWQQQISKSPFKRINLEMILLHLIRSKNRISFSSLVRKLSELQNQVASGQTPHIFEIKKEETQPTSLETKKPIIPCEKPPSETLHTPEVKKEEALPTSLETKKPIIPCEKSPSETLHTPEAKKEEALPSSLETKKPITSSETIHTPKIKEERDLPAPSLKTEIPTLASEKNEPPQKTEDPAVFFHPTPSPLPFEKKKPSTSKKIEPPQEPLEQAAPISAATQSRYDTLIRFAAIELEGTIKNESRL